MGIQRIPLESKLPKQEGFLTISSPMTYLVSLTVPALPPLLLRPSRTQRPGLACPGYNDELCRISKQPWPGQMGTNDKGQQEGPALGWYFFPPLTSWKCSQISVASKV